MGISILIVDDDKLLVEKLEETVNWSGIGIDMVFTANNIRQAQKLLEEYPIEMLLCDIEMPQGNGLELLEWIRYKKLDIECTFLSSYANFAYAQMAGVPLVIAKCMSQMHANILKKVGADRVVMAESETGIRLGKSLISGGFQDFFMLSDSFSMVELPVPEAWTGHNLEELDLRKKYSINVIAVKDGEDIRVTVNPKTLLRAEEVLILIGENKELAKLMKNRK